MQPTEGAGWTFFVYPLIFSLIFRFSFFKMNYK